MAMGLTVTWGMYAYLKKRLPIGPNQGFTLEVILLLPAALALSVWTEARGAGAFLAGSLTDTVLLLGCGIVTAVPLMVYANGAKLLKLSTIGMLQYIAPTMIFLTAVFLFREPFGGARTIAFPMIWGALALYSWSLVQGLRQRPADG
jgi:chloramphenicol-sensitive protein RarD